MFELNLLVYDKEEISLFSFILLTIKRSLSFWIGRHDLSTEYDTEYLEKFFFF